MIIEEIQEYKKGKRRICFEDHTSWILYAGEIRKYQLKEGMDIPEETVEEILTQVIGKRAIRRAMHLLEKMNRTEKGLREKLQQNEYPQCAIEDAVDYVKSYHYIDDYRYACSYIRTHQEKKSRQRLRMDLYAKGVDKEVIERAFEEEYESDEAQMIYTLLEKKGYQKESADEKERRRIYGFLMRRGFRSEDILRAMKNPQY